MFSKQLVASVLLVAPFLCLAAINKTDDYFLNVNELSNGTSSIVDGNSYANSSEATVDNTLVVAKQKCDSKPDTFRDKTWTTGSNSKTTCKHRETWKNSHTWSGSVCQAKETLFKKHRTECVRTD
ncbi:hypothetical protein OTK49_03165 [Vibrio coralliirubri]|uniref:hypothetical protein n=1 Tax=Vibrio coralliirubri TaxID=1516159 RepID=UPI002285074C|nr:hypothetical protein [Vibrio coralliirubri]MCY9861516.1 hypothetical protein [Vibrio coralliirubri]